MLINNKPVRYIPVFFLSVLILSSCITNELEHAQENMLITQSFSIPLGQKPIFFPTPKANEASTTSGPNGSFFYDDVQYPNPAASFSKLFQVDVNLNDQIDKYAATIKYISFHVTIANSFPSQINTKIILFNNNNFQFYSNNLNVGALKTEVFDIPIQAKDLKLIETALHLEFTPTIYTPDGIRLTVDSKVTISVGARLQVEYTKDDLLN